jgi:hypothetical protein
MRAVVILDLICGRTDFCDIDIITTRLSVFNLIFEAIEA